ncbi:sensor histidine kinase [Mycobacterium sp. djl-10]|nr:sensor histidine kinase [Mycobacterium sp. djl-10]
MIRIGTSGWSYDHWENVLYPPGLPTARRLAHYVEVFDTVELNASFYRWPRDSTFAGWRTRLPEGFTMTVKAHRGLTHFGRLSTPEPWVERFERCWAALGERCEMLLVQLHPELERDDARLEHFLAVMPDQIPVAVEFRHPSWDDNAVYHLLERHGATYVVTSGAHLPCVLRATSSRVYVRMHGPDPDVLYAGSYSDDDLRWWRDRVREWQEQGRDVLVYFNNDGDGNAVRNALRLRELLSS